MRNKCIFTKPALAAMALFVSLAICQAASAQSSGAPSWNNSRAASPNTGVTESADACAVVCSASAMCASYSYRPFPAVRGGRSGGQCQFNRTSVPNFENGVISGLPTRSAVSATIAEATPPNRSPASPPLQTSSNYNGTRGANYAVTPLTPNRQTNAVALNNPPPTPINTNGAAVSFERPPATPVTARPASAPAPTQTARAAPAPAAPNQTQARTQAHSRPPVTQTAAPTQLAAPVVNQMPTAAPAPRAAATTGIEQFRGPDGMIDAAEMRRAQLRNQQAQNTPQYSVQHQWTSAADEQLTGRSTEGVDWTQSRPVPMAAEPTPRARGNGETATNTETTRNNPDEGEQLETSSRPRGPLRKRAQ